MKLVFPDETLVVEKREDYGRFVIRPLSRGYGHTLGNALRRVILSPIPGLAVVAVRIEGTDGPVLHEFSTISGMLEDVPTLILNLKRLRFRKAGGFRGKAEVFLHKRGAGEVTARDLELPGELEVVNPDHPIATLTEDSAVLRLEMWVYEGIGYVPAEELDQEFPEVKDLPQMYILTDALFSPIEKVNFTVEGTRVGARTDYDQLVLDIWTDGTVDPEDAFLHASRTLSEVFERIQFVSRVQAEASPEPIGSLGLSARVERALEDAGITTVGQLVEMTPSEVLALPKIGEKALSEIREALERKGLRLKEEVHETP